MLNNMAGGGDCCWQKNEYWVGKEKDKKRRKKSLRIGLKTRWRGSIIKIFFSARIPGPLSLACAPLKNFPLLPALDPILRNLGHSGLVALDTIIFEISPPPILKSSDRAWIWSMYHYFSISPIMPPPPPGIEKKTHSTSRWVKKWRHYCNHRAHSQKLGGQVFYVNSIWFWRQI